MCACWDTLDLSHCTYLITGNFQITALLYSALTSAMKFNISLNEDRWRRWWWWAVLSRSGLPMVFVKLVLHVIEMSWSWSQLPLLQLLCEQFSSALSLPLQITLFNHIGPEPAPNVLPIARPDDLNIAKFIIGCTRGKPRVGPGTPLPPCPFTSSSFPPLYFSLSFIGFTYFLLLSNPSLCTRIVPLRFQAGGRRWRPNLVLVCFGFVLCVICIP